MDAGARGLDMGAGRRERDDVMGLTEVELCDRLDAQLYAPYPPFPDLVVDELLRREAQWVESEHVLIILDTAVGVSLEEAVLALHALVICAVAAVARDWMMTMLKYCSAMI